MARKGKNHAPSTLRVIDAAQRISSKENIYDSMTTEQLRDALRKQFQGESTSLLIGRLMFRPI